MQTGKARRSRPLRARDQVFGARWQALTFLHRVPAGLKVALLTVITVVIVVCKDPVVSGAVIAATVLVSVFAGISLRATLSILARIWIMLVLILLLQILTADVLAAVEVLLRIVAGVLAAHVLILTTSTESLLRVFGWLLWPLSKLGVPTDRWMLAALVMLRAIPYLADLWWLAAQRAKSRGLERDIRARTVPVVLGAVAYARDTGRALHARGISGVGG